MNLPVPASNASDLPLLRQMQMLLAERDQEIASLKHQLSWFKQQLFGEKSEKRLIDNPDQLALGEILKDTPPEQEVPTETITYERRKKQRPEDCVTDQGLRFNDDVPIKLIHLPTPLRSFREKTLTSMRSCSAGLRMEQKTSLCSRH